jgi:KipI family sensor histidine kinase inhibitor
VNARVQRLAARLSAFAEHEAGFGSPVPSYASVLVPVDPLGPGVDDAVRRLADIVAVGAQDESAPVEGSVIEIETRYGGDDGPDLLELASVHGLTAEEIIARHASVEYRVYLLGFAPGFAYLASVPEAIRTPRRTTPRTAVPAGSVGIAGEQTAIYPFETPGGWQIIGRTERRMWDTAADPPALLAPGDRVRFVPIG